MTTRIPADQLHARRWPMSREAMWSVIRELKTFTVRQIEHRTHAGHKQIREYIKSLALAGFIEEAGHAANGRPGTQAKVFRLVRDPGVEAPRVRRDGTLVAQGSSREQMWRTMRILGEFSIHELAVHASTEEIPVHVADAKDYLRYLQLAGYLAISQPGGPGQPIRYRFLPSRYTGPKPPQVQRVKHLWDPNLGRVVWPREDDR